ncbi:MAG: DUF4056 domain-containing protein [Polyangia bacterium]
MKRLHALLSIAVFSLACNKTVWKAGTGVLAPVRPVAIALDDPVDVGTPFNSAAVPVIDAPRGLRPCCAFGDDMKVKLGVEIPGYQKENIISVEEVGTHGYDNGLLGIESSHGKANLEKNALLYTCRGGFIDTAHVRDNADLTLFLSMHLAKQAPLGTTIDLPSDGAQRRVTVKKLPEGLIEKYGRWAVVTKMAEWTAYHLSIWHEIVTWYGYENIKGFSEKLSAFSPEDLYSNILGLRLAGGLIRNQDARTREEYDRAMDAWIKEALRRLGAVSKKQGKEAMKAIDGVWWDSSKPIPDSAVVTHRNLNTKTPMTPWLVSMAVPKGGKNAASALIDVICPNTAPPLVLDVPDKIGDVKIADLVSIDFTFTSWAPKEFPYPNPENKVVTLADYPMIIETIRKEAAKELGPDFDKPTPPTP